MTSRLLKSFALALPLALIAGACGGTVDQGGDDNGSPHNDASTGSQDGSGGRDSTTIGDSGRTDGTTTGETSTGLPCGASTCSADTQECCVRRGGSMMCTAKGDCDGGVAIACSGPEECPVSGDVCCAELGGGGASVSCTTMTACHGLVLCQSAADCPDDEPCDPGLEGYKYCHPDGGFHHHHDGGGFHPPDGGFVPPDGDLPP